MSSAITLSAATHQNLLSLQDTASLLSTTQSRLSTGKKVNSALDNPVNFFTAQNLSSRSSDLNSLLDGISNGIQTIQTANQGITNIQKLVDSAKSTAQQALATQATATGASATGASVAATKSLNSALASGSGGTGAAADGTHDFSGSNSAAFTVADAFGGSTTVTLNAANFGSAAPDLTKVTSAQILTQINKQLTAAGGNGAQATASLTSDGKLIFTSTGTGSDAKLTVTGTSGNTDIGFGVGASAAVTASGVDATDGSAKASATGAAIGALTGAGTLDLTSGDASITLQLGTGAQKKITLTKAADANLNSATLNATTVAKAINDQINADTGLQGKVVAVADTTKGTISLHTTASGSDQKLVVASAASATKDIGFGTAADATKAQTGLGAGTTAANGGNARDALAQQFNDILAQISQTAQDTSFNGVNLLYRSGSDPKENTLHLTFNEKDTSFLDVKGVKLDATGLGISKVSGGFATNDDIKTALSQLTNASSTLRSQSSTFGSNLTVVQNRQDFTKNLANILDTGAANLTNADLNEEAANSQALSTRNSLGISALSLANQAQQGILQLLR
jgi:flagellin